MATNLYTYAEEQKIYTQAIAAKDYKIARETVQKVLRSVRVILSESRYLHEVMIATATARWEQFEKAIPVIDNKECVVCFEREKDTLFLPCKHMQVCGVCADRHSECPVCRTKIENKIKGVYF